MKLLQKMSFALVLAVVFASCSKSNDNNSEADLVGTWNLTSKKTNGETQELDACDLKHNLVFTSTKVTSTDYEGENCMDIEVDVFSYTTNGNILKVTNGVDTMEIEFSLTATTLEMTQSEEHEGETYVSFRTFKKQ